MKRLSIVLCFLAFFGSTSISGFAQERIIYLDLFDNETKAANYKYKRVIKYKEPILIPIIERDYYGSATARVKDTGAHYCTVTDYLKTGELWLVGKIISSDVRCSKLHGFDGQVVYYRKNGDILRREPWKYGKKHGVVNTYDEEGNEFLELREEYVNGEKIDASRFSAPADSPITGTWKYIEYLNNDSRERVIGSVRLPPTVLRTSTFIYSQNGIVESIHQTMMGTSKIKGNWKYILKSASSGILEEYQGENLIERGTVKWLSRDQLEYTVTFNQNSDSVGKQSVWTRQ